MSGSSRMSQYMENVTFFILMGLAFVGYFIYGYYLKRKKK